jgi:ParB family chromosome partitioning protein
MTDPTAVANPAVIQDIPVDQIGPSRHQARKDFDEEDTKQLAESIDKEGLIQPITLRKVGDGYEVVTGERRLRAVKSLGRTTIEARVIEVVNEAAACAKGLVENLQRKDLNPIEEAEGFQKLNQLDSKYWDQPQIAQVSGKTQDYVSRSLKLLSLPDSVLESMRRRILSRSHGIELGRLPSKEMQLEASKAMENGLKRDEARKLVDGMLAKAAGKEDQAGNQPIKAAVPFKFTKKESNVAISASFPEGGDFDKFLADLREAYLAWSSKTAQKTDPTAPGATEDEDLLAARTGPAALCARICGAEDSRTKLLEGKTWADFGITTPEEGLKAFMEGKITERR